MRHFALALGTIATPCLSQSTDCYPIGNTIHCDTRQLPNSQSYNFLPKPFDAMETMRAYEQARQAKTERDAQEHDRISSSNEQYFAKEAGNMIANGQCSQARTYALSNGQFDLAERIERACTPKP